MSIPTPFLHLVDDAAIFPPGLAPLEEAVGRHRAHRRSPHADLVGPFIIDTRRLPTLMDLPEVDGLAVSVVVPSWEHLLDVVDSVESSVLHLAGLEVKLTGTTPVDQQVESIADAAPDRIATYVEAPRPQDASWPSVLDAVARHGLRLKFRTGGTEDSAFPTEPELSVWIAAAAQARVPFKATAGLHHAVRHTGPTTGFEHHGYLNLLLATAQAIAGEPVEPTLAERDPTVLAHLFARLDDRVLADARQKFVSYGSCSVLDPLDDLTRLGLIRAPAAEETS